MASEITVVTRLAVSNANLTWDSGALTLSIDQSTQGGPTPGYVTIGTSEESYAFSELASLGWLYMRNLDATNYVEWGFSSGVYGGKCSKTEPALFRLKPGTTLYLKANTAACKMVIYVLDS